SIYLPALPHGNALPPKSLDLYRKTVHELETADITIFHENEDPYALIPHADLVMIDSGYFLYDLLFHEIPFIFFETQFATTLTEYRSFLQPNSWREFQQRDPQQLPGAPILQNLINLPDEMQRARDNRESVQETLRGLKHAFLSDHVGKSTDRLIEAVIGASLEEPPAENLLSRIVNNDLSNPKQFRKDVAFE
ncbi:MAG: hypothetical protein HYS57_00230, partial [Parcubacteria group bacterium]|nr:hypothetical protein [Parcubacteria group bacterium]